jgi:hypothetical protein
LVLCRNPDRNYSVGGDSLSTEQLRRLEEIRGSSADLSRDNSDTASSPGGQLRNVLPSPRVSPEMWSEVPEVVVNTERDDYGKYKFNKEIIHDKVFFFKSFISNSSSKDGISKQSYRSFRIRGT